MSYDIFLEVYKTINLKFQSYVHNYLLDNKNINVYTCVYSNHNGYVETMNVIKNKNEYDIIISPILKDINGSYFKLQTIIKSESILKAFPNATYIPIKKNEFINVIITYKGIHSNSITTKSKEYLYGSFSQYLLNYNEINSSYSLVISPSVNKIKSKFNGIECPIIMSYKTIDDCISVDEYFIEYNKLIKQEHEHEKKEINEMFLINYDKCKEIKKEFNDDCIYLFVDFESITGKFIEIEKAIDIIQPDFVFQIGVVDENNNYYSFVCKDYSFNEKEKIWKSFIHLIQSKEKIHSKKVICCHYAPHEYLCYKNNKEQFNLDDIQWFDMFKLTKKIFTSMNGYSLKWISKKMNELNPSIFNITYNNESSILNGLDAMACAMKYYGIHIDKMSIDEEKIFIEELEKYNKLDCMVLKQLYMFINMN
jgi:hypothetical protein